MGFPGMGDDDHHAICKLHVSNEKQTKKLPSTREACLQTGDGIKEGAERLFVHSCQNWRDALRVLTPAI